MRSCVSLEKYHDPYALRILLAQSVGRMKNAPRSPACDEVTIIESGKDTRGSPANPPRARRMSILIYKDEQQSGPFDLQEIQNAITDGQVSEDDLAWQEGCTDWVPLRTLLPAAQPDLPRSVFAPEAIAVLTADEQDAGTVENALNKAAEFMTPGEEVIYVGAQKKPPGAAAPDAMILTDKQILIVRGKTLDVEHHGWSQISNVEISVQLLTATITCAISGGRKMSLAGLPKKQARKIYSFAREIEEKQSWWEERGY